MRIYTLQKQNYLLLALIVTAFSVSLSSCSKIADNEIYTNPNTADVMFIQASADEPALDLFINNNSYVGGFFNYGDNSAYLSLVSGPSNVVLSSNITGQTVISDSVTFKPSGVYSMFLANKPTQPEIVLLADTLLQPAANAASIRFVDLSPDAPAVDLVVQGGATLVPNKSYKGYSSFASIPSGKTYTFEVHQAGTSTVLATLSNVQITTGNIYTVWFHGLAAGTTTSDQLAVSIIDNY